jgi:hypothetical protein
VRGWSDGISMKPRLTTVSGPSDEDEMHGLKHTSPQSAAATSTTTTTTTTTTTPPTHENPNPAKRKTSFLSALTGTSTRQPLTDQELMKHTGMTREQLMAYSPGRNRAAAGFAHAGGSPAVLGLATSGVGGM